MKTINQLIMPASARINSNGHLEIGGCDCVDLARKFGTPLYAIDEISLRQSCREYWRAFDDYDKIRMMYASKANINKTICTILHQEGYGLEVVSGGEIFIAQKAGFPMEDVSFNGNNKSHDEIRMAISSNVGRIVADNFVELEMLNKTAVEMNRTIKILLRITPGIECHTHQYIRTGHIDSKFGFDLSQINDAVKLIVKEYHNLDLTGLHAHIGSQIFELEVFHDEVAIILERFARIRDRHHLNLTEINVGGGLGIRYTAGEHPPSRYKLARTLIESIRENTRKFRLEEPTVILEPGRSIIGTAGVTLYTVGTRKQVPGGTLYIAVDGGMADNPRPAMYQAEYEAVIANKPGDDSSGKVTVAGRYCESGDILIEDISLPPVEAGDILCVFNTGAYNQSMASNYNSIPRPGEVLLCSGNAELMVRRETYEDITARQLLPERIFNSPCAGEECMAGL